MSCLMATGTGKGTLVHGGQASPSCPQASPGPHSLLHWVHYCSGPFHGHEAGLECHPVRPSAPFRAGASFHL